MTLEEQLLDQLVNHYKIKGKNLQGVLDNPLFKDLPLDTKVKFIQNYKEQLSTDPRFNWSAVAKGAAGGAIGSGMAVRLGQLIAGKNDPRAIAFGIGLGAAFGGLGSAQIAGQALRNDRETVRNLDDAIQALIVRKQIGTVDPFSKVKSMYGNFPEQVAPAFSREYYNNYVAK